jgi:hypothetical protein
MLLVNALQPPPRTRLQPVHADMQARCPDCYAVPLKAFSIALSLHRHEPSLSPSSSASNPRCILTAVASLQIPIAHRSD